MAGFHIGVRSKAAGQVVRCTAREGMCKLTGADGELTQHFASLADGEAYLAEQENVSKGGFIAAAGNNASETSDDADTTVNYDETITDALQYHNDTLKQLEHVTKILENINQSRNFLNEYIVSPAGDLIAPQLFPTITDKIALLERSGKYFATANETERKLNAIANSVRAILGRNAALALTSEVHRLTHQEDEAGALLRDLREREIGLTITVRPYSSNIYSFAATADVCASSDKLALLDQANDRLCAAMKHYDREAAELMLTRFFNKEADEWATPHSSHSLNVNDLPTVRDAESANNMRASESQFGTVDTMLTRRFYVEARGRLSEAISNASKNMSSRIKNA